MELKEFIQERVHYFYWQEDINCATTMLRTLGEIFQVELSSQIINAAIGMHGAGKFGAQCGLVEGSLMFLGIWGKEKGLPEQEIVDKCYNLASDFQKHFGSLLCRELRPEGFKPANPPHLCEEITKQAVEFTAYYLKNNLNLK